MSVSHRVSHSRMWLSPSQLSYHRDDGESACQGGVFGFDWRSDKWLSGLTDLFVHAFVVCLNPEKLNHKFAFGADPLELRLHLTQQSVKEKHWHQYTVTDDVTVPAKKGVMVGVSVTGTRKTVAVLYLPCLLLGPSITLYPAVTVWGNVTWLYQCLSPGLLSGWCHPSACLSCEWLS